ncbi:MAG: helix-hairpin-helix domain-containing protein [Sediminibacterium sp.]|nr:helix-hairpin-helix domain-containing protein [Sediminibacterium sp.]
MKDFLQQYFRFSRKERIGLSILLTGMALFFWLPGWYKTKPLPVQPDTAMMRMMEASVSADRWSGSQNRFSGKGSYRQPYRQAYPHLSYQKQSWYRRSYPGRRTYSPRPIPVVEINTAGLAEWEALPGIGPVLAARIIKYRDKLGGFTRMEQVGQTYGITDSLYRALKPFLQKAAGVVQRDTPFLIRLPNANTATRAELEATGIPEQIARSIVVYRSRYGLFKSIGDLRQIVLINDSVYRIISGKLRVE